MGYYSEIKEELDLLPEDGSLFKNIKRGCESLFSACHEYARVYRINEDIKDVKNILKNYMDDEGQLKNIAKEEKQDKESLQENSRKRGGGLDIYTKLYIEYFWKCYENHYQFKTQEDFCGEIIKPFAEGKEKVVQDIWKDMFKNRNPQFLTCKTVKNAISSWAISRENIINLDSLNLENLHNAMSILGNSLEDTDISIEDSVELVLHAGVLEYIRDSLRLKKYPHCFIMIAPVRRALTTGEMKSYLPVKGNTTIFFNTKCEYNLSTLKEYINALQELYEDYVMTRQILEEDII